MSEGGGGPDDDDRSFDSGRRRPRSGDGAAGTWGAPPGAGERLAQARSPRHTRSGRGAERRLPGRSPRERAGVLACRSRHRAFCPAGRDRAWASRARTGRPGASSCAATPRPCARARRCAFADARPRLEGWCFRPRAGRFGLRDGQARLRPCEAGVQRRERRSWTSEPTFTVVDISPAVTRRLSPANSIRGILGQFLSRLVSDFASRRLTTGRSAREGRGQGFPDRPIGSLPVPSRTYANVCS